MRYNKIIEKSFCFFLLLLFLSSVNTKTISAKDLASALSDASQGDIIEQQSRAYLLFPIDLQVIQKENL